MKLIEDIAPLIVFLNVAFVVVAIVALLAWRKMCWTQAQINEQILSETEELISTQDEQPE